MKKANKENFWIFGDNEHKTVRLPIKVCDVDEQIVPVVEWLNGMMEVFTLWSCQGEEERYCEDFGGNAITYSYVAFMCRGDEQYADIMKIVTSFSAMHPTSDISVSAEKEKKGEIENTIFNLSFMPEFLPRFVEHLKEKSHVHEDIGSTGSVHDPEDEGSV